MLRDLSQSLRSLRRQPLLTLLTVGTLALGIGGTTAIFSTVNAVLLAPLPYPQFEDLATVRTALTDGRTTRGLLAPIEVVRLNAAEDGPVEHAAGYTLSDDTLLDDTGAPMKVALSAVSEGFFEMFGLPMTVGRSFSPDEHVRGAPTVAVLSDHLWRAAFGADPEIMGKTVSLITGPVAVVGVAAPDLDAPPGTDMWLNLRWNPEGLAHGFEGYLRKRHGASPDQLAAGLAAVMAVMAEEFPADQSSRIFVARPLLTSMVGDLGPTLVIVLGATLLLLALACVNVVNLLLARDVARLRDVAVRVAMGASRARIVREHLAESLLVTGLGTLAGLLLAFLGVRLALALGAGGLPRLDRVPFNTPVLLVAVGTLLATTVLTGLGPAVRLSRADARGLLNEGGRRASLGRGAQRFLNCMVVAEIAVALTLVAGAGMLRQSYGNLLANELGFAPEGRMAFDLRLSGPAYRDRERVASFSRELIDRVAGIPGVTAAGSASALPLGWEWDGTNWIQISGEELDPDDPTSMRGTRFHRVSPEFFAAMGTRIIAGRGFTSEDTRDSMPVTIINATFARLYLAGKDPLKEWLAHGFPNINQERQLAIVGVVEDVRYASPALSPEPAFYLVMDQTPYGRQTLVVATALPDPAAIVPTVRAEIARLDPGLAVEVTSVAEVAAAAVAPQRLGMLLMSLFALMALALAAVGIGGVVGFAVAQRTDEVATRMALGATARNIFALLIKHGFVLATAGVTAGLALAYIGGAIVTSRLYEVSGSDPRILASALVLVVAIVAPSFVIPARRAARVDCARSLR